MLEKVIRVRLVQIVGASGNQNYLRQSVGISGSEARCPGLCRPSSTFPGFATHRMLWNRPLNTSRADHMTLTRDGRSLFVSALLDNRVYRIATATGEITGHLVSGIYPHDNKVSRDGRRLYNTSIGPIASLPRPAGAPPLADTPGYPFQFTVANVGTLEITDRIRLDQAFRPWQFTSDEKIIYAQIANEHAVVAHDVAARKATRRLELPTARRFASLAAPRITLRSFAYLTSP
jgi:hypothetical protein